MQTRPLFKLVVGLGNPGPDYQETRHNAGFWLLDELASQYHGRFTKQAKFFGETCKISVAGQELWLLKPHTFMNRSGQSVQALARFYRIECSEILVAHDELDMVPGRAAVKHAGGHGGHNGLRDMVSKLGANDFWRLRIGIGHPGDKNRVSAYVLSRPSKQEEQAIQDSCALLRREFDDLIGGSFARAAQSINSVKP